MIDLQSVKNATDAEIVILVDEKGNVIDSLNTEYDANIALMVETAFSMCKDLSADLNNGDLVQLLAKSSDGYYIANKLKDNSVIMITSKDQSKLGLLLKFMSTEGNFNK